MTVDSLSRSKITDSATLPWAAPMSATSLSMTRNSPRYVPVCRNTRCCCGTFSSELLFCVELLLQQFEPWALFGLFPELPWAAAAEFAAPDVPFTEPPLLPLLELLELLLLLLLELLPLLLLFGDDPLLFVRYSST